MRHNKSLPLPFEQEAVTPASSTVAPSSLVNKGASHTYTPSRAVKAQKLWMAIYLTDFSVDVLHCSDNGIDGVEFNACPSAVTDTFSLKARILSANTQALRRGIEPGMAVNTACALLPELRLLERDPSAEAEALQALACWLGQFTSFLTIVDDNNVLLEVGGSLALFGGLDSLCQRIEVGIKTLGYNLQWAVAPTPLGACWLSRSGVAQSVTVLERLMDKLAAVPLRCLALPEQTEEALASMGLERFGDVCRLPRDGLARRFGVEFVELLDKALGKHDDIRIAFEAPVTFSRRVSFESECEDIEHVLYVLQRITMELVGYLAAKEKGLAGFSLALRFYGYKEAVLPVALVSPSRDADHLLNIMREHLERITLPGPVHEVLFVADAQQIQSLAPVEQGLFSTQSAPDSSWQNVVERLSARLSARAVHGLAVTPDHRPECAWQREVPTLSNTSSAAHFVRPQHSARPLWLLTEPKPLTLSNGVPCYGGTLQLESGPERIETGWWDNNEVMRDYYVASNAYGRRYWIFKDRDSDPRWYLHGVFA